MDHTHFELISSVCIPAMAPKSLVMGAGEPLAPMHFVLPTCGFDLSCAVQIFTGIPAVTANLHLTNIRKIMHAGT